MDASSSGMNSVRFWPHWNPGDPRQVVGFLHLVHAVVGALGNGIHWVELGGFLGESATLVLGFPQVTRLDVIESSQTHADALRRRFSGVPYCNVMHARSVDAADAYGPCSVDVVYIDADHSYDAVSADIDAWLPKIRHGGYICGHDYHDGFPGVRKAVDERLTVDAVFSDSSWIGRAI